jgi:hypothetical protein
MEDQRILHYFIGTICNFAPATIPVTQVPDSQVVQDEVICADDLHQSDEIILEETEAVEDSFVEDDTIEVTEEEVKYINDEVVHYTDPAGNTFEAPVIPDPEDDEVYESPAPEPENDAFEYKVEEANLDLVPEKVEELQEANFDLDFNTDDAEENTDNVPDFF